MSRQEYLLSPSHRETSRLHQFTKNKIKFALPIRNGHNKKRWRRSALFYHNCFNVWTGNLRSIFITINLAHFFEMILAKSILKYWRTAQKIKSSIKDFFSKCDQIRSFLGIWSYLLKKSLMENFFFVQWWLWLLLELLEW